MIGHVNPAVNARGQSGWQVASRYDVVFLESDLDEYSFSQEMLGLFPETFHVDWRPATVDMQPLSSFSTNTQTASSFAPDHDNSEWGARPLTHSTLLRTIVPVEWIWGHSADGFGSLREHELLVIGSSHLRFEAITWPIGLQRPSLDTLSKALG